MNRCVIIGAADINNYEYVGSRISEDDFLIYCDAGLKHADALAPKDFFGPSEIPEAGKFSPDLIIGDFDSYGDITDNDGTCVPPEICSAYPDAEIIPLPHIKDDTDTFFAAKEALRRGFKDFLFIGVIGNRLDHTLANVSILTHIAVNGAHAIAIDDYSEMEVVVAARTTISPEFSYFSIICLSDKLEGVTIKNAKYPLDGGTITPAYQYATSNEPLKNATAEISIGSGIALIVKIV